MSGPSAEGPAPVPSGAETPTAAFDQKHPHVAAMLREKASGAAEAGPLLGEEARERIGRDLGRVLIGLDPEADVFEWHHCEGCKQWLRGEPCPCAGAPYAAPALLDHVAALVAAAEGRERERIAVALETRADYKLAQWVRDESQRQERDEALAAAEERGAAAERERVDDLRLYNERGQVIEIHRISRVNSFVTTLEGTPRVRKVELLRKPS